MKIKKTVIDFQRFIAENKTHWLKNVLAEMIL